MSSGEQRIADALAYAAKIREAAYAPYSGFRVGAVLLGRSGVVHSGVNVENLSFGLTMCAERVAVGAAISKGEHEFELLALLTDAQEPVAPCGGCRQVLAEFCSELHIVSATTRGARSDFYLSDLLPARLHGILRK